MNFFHSFFPTLLKLPGFLVEFITPIVKVQVMDGGQMDIVFLYNLMLHSPHTCSYP